MPIADAASNTVKHFKLRRGLALAVELNGYFAGFGEEPDVAPIHAAALALEHAIRSAAFPPPSDPTDTTIHPRAA